MTWLRLLALIAASVIQSPSHAQDSGRPLVRTELEKDSTIPGQPITFRVTVLSPTWFPRPPAFPTFETPNVIVRLPPDSSHPTTDRVEGQSWSGVTRDYLLYPMTVGRFRIPPQKITVTHADPETRENRITELATEAVVFAGIAPEGAEDLDPFLAAASLLLEQNLEGTPGDLEPGAAFTRTVTARVTGTSPMFLAPLIPAHEAPGLRAYPKEPVVTEDENAESIGGERVESVTYVAEAGGRHTAPPVRVRWFNLGEQRVETTEVPGFDIASSGPPPAATTGFDRGKALFWIVAVVALAVLAAVTRRFVAPVLVRWRQQRHETYLRSEECAFARVQDVVRRRDVGQTLVAVEAWQQHWPAMPEATEAHITQALTVLGGALYGSTPASPPARGWSELSTAIQMARQESASRVRRDGRTLPPLNPVA